MMMKKLLIFVLVFGIASMANAGLQISVHTNPTGGETWDPQNPQDTEITINPNDELLLSVYATGGNTGDSFFALLADNVLGIINGWSGITNIPPAPDAATLLGPAGPEMNFLGGLAGRDGVVGTVGSFTAFPPYPDGVYFEQILFTCGDFGDALIELVEVDTVNWTVAGMPVMDTVIIHQIPEPTTVLLLSLGGLFLRRRR